MKAEYLVNQRIQKLAENEEPSAADILAKNMTRGANYLVNNPSTMAGIGGTVAGGVGGAALGKNLPESLLNATAGSTLGGLSMYGLSQIPEVNEGMNDQLSRLQEKMNRYKKYSKANHSDELGNVIEKLKQRLQNIEK